MVFRKIELNEEGLNIVTQKILITPRTFGVADAEPLEYLKRLGYEVVTNPYGRLLTEAELINEIHDVDGLIVGLDPVTKDVMDAAKKLKVISKYGVGVDNIDVDYATSRGIPVTNTPGTNNTAVAELTIGLILDVARQISHSFRKICRGEWERSQGLELGDKVLGVIGTGQIGKEVARLAKAFRMDIMCYDIHSDADWAEEIGAKYVPLHDLLTSSDIVSLHLPLCNGTKHLISSAELALMKPTAILINTARGGVVDEEALYNALQDKKIAGAGLDVFETEPPFGSPLLRLDNVVMTAHIGSHTGDSISRMGWLAVRNLVAELTGHRAEYLVNREVGEKGLK